jgi:hypothetical protein
MQTPSWLHTFVWTEYRLAVLVMVIIPMVLLIWAFVQKVDAMQHLLAIYWRASSLMLITMYLLIAAWPIGFMAGWLAMILVPISLWFWIDLNEEIADRPQTPLKLTFMSWRWAASIYCVGSAIAQIPFLRCALTKSEDLLQDPSCRVWLEAPWVFREYFHSATRPYFLGFLALIGLVIYVLYLGYFVVIRLGKQGRSATGQ